MRRKSYVRMRAFYENPSQDAASSSGYAAMTCNVCEGPHEQEQTMLRAA